MSDSPGVVQPGALGRLNLRVRGFDVAEIQGERHLLLSCQRRALAEHQHRVTVHARIDRGRVLLASKGLTDIDARAFSTDHGMQRGEGDGHGETPSFTLIRAP